MEHTMHQGKTTRRATPTAQDFRDLRWRKDHVHYRRDGMTGRLTEHRRRAHLAAQERLLRLEESRPVWVNVYDRWQEFGGPEEGGWWFWREVPVQSVLCRNAAHARALEAKLEKRYDRQLALNASYDGYLIRVEGHRARWLHKNRPHYE